MGAVVDASVTLPWFLHDERTAFTDAVFAGLGQVEYWVPAVWRLEFPNTLLIAERANVEIEFGKPQLPNFPLPAGFESDSEYGLSNVPETAPDAT